jgi:hypothetical protein
VNPRKRPPRQKDYDELEREAAEFFSVVPKAERTEALAFQAAALKSMTREWAATQPPDIGKKQIESLAKRRRRTRRPVP